MREPGEISLNSRKPRKKLMSVPIRHLASRQRQTWKSLVLIGNRVSCTQVVHAIKVAALVQARSSAARESTCNCARVKEFE